MTTHRQVNRRVALGVMGGAGLVSLGVLCVQHWPRPPLVMHADYPSFDSMPDITSQADAVLITQFLSAHNDVLLPAATGGTSENDPQRGRTLSPQEQRDMGVPITIAHMRVTRTLKGPARPGDTIRVSQPGGTPDGQKFVEPSTPLLADFADVVPNRSFLLMLAAFGDRFSVLNPQMEIYGVNGSGTLLSLDPASGTVGPALHNSRSLTVKDASPAR